MESVWKQGIQWQHRPRLQGDMEVEAAVIGGGMAGILTAYFLQRRNVKTIVLEAAKIGSGQTGNTTAKITSQHNLIYHKLMQEFGEEKARQYARANQEAIEEYRRLVKELGIDCALEDRPAYLYCRDEAHVGLLEQETDAAKELGIHAELTLHTTLPFSVAGAVKFHDQAQFQPLTFLQAIAKCLTIYEGTRVITVEDQRIMTDCGTVKAKYIVFATHFPFLNRPGYYFARMHQERSYVLALQKAARLDGMYLGIDGDELSFRNYGDYLLLGGGGHRTGENSAGGKYALLREKAAQYYPGSTEEFHWSAQDCMTLDGVPYIGQFSPATPHWYVATGFGKWGMTSSMVSARLISDQIAGISHPCAEVFSPHRFTPTASVKTFLTDMGQAVKGIGRRVFTIPETNVQDLPRGHGGVVDWQGEKVGVYKDEEDTVHVVSTRCPHLGCQLEWNPDEKSWDCPCHGSRFDFRGNLLDNPAQTPLETENE